MKPLLFTIIVFSMFISCQGLFTATDYPFRISQHSLDVQIDPVAHQLDIQDSFTFSSENPQKSVFLMLHKSSLIESVTMDSKPLEFTLHTELDPAEFGITEEPEELETDYADAAKLEIQLPQLLTAGEIAMNYRLAATDSVNEAAFSREYIAYQVKGYAGEKGIFISPAYFWYPQAPGSLSRFEVKAQSPENLFVVTQGEMADSRVENGIRHIRWVIDYPTDGIHLVGSEFEIQEAAYNNVKIYTFFFPETQDLAASYLSACQRYLAMYEEMIGPYPFSKFAVVENFFPTGYGMPSYTLLGSQVLRLPFIIYTSLGHEITHNWWGNSVYVDYESGNWCEGLTSYFADYHYKELRSAADARDYRRNLNRDFTVYVKEEKDFPLQAFESRTESSSRAIGYGKSAMVFHQLRSMIGDSLFRETFRKFYQDFKFKKASWKDIQQTAQAVSGEDLSWFFDQWTTRSGAPALSFDNISYREGKIDLTVSQASTAFRLLLPLKIEFADTVLVEKIWLERPAQNFEIAVPAAPQKISLDPDFEVFRMLDKRETPPSLAEMFAHENAIIVLPDNASPEKSEAYRKIAEAFSEANDHISMKQIDELDEAALQDSSFYLLGLPAENSLIGKLATDPQTELQQNADGFNLSGETHLAANEVLVMSLREQENLERNICIIAMGEEMQTGRIGVLLKHYGKYSYLVFRNGRNAIKEIFSTGSGPLVHQF